MWDDAGQDFRPSEEKLRLPIIPESRMLHLEGAIIRFDDVVVIFKDLGIGFDGVYHGLSFKLVNRPLLLALVEFFGMC